MTLEKATLEVIAPTVDEAVARGLSQLGLTEEAVNVEVLDAGTRGLFGLGQRQARIRLTVKNEEQPAPTTPTTGEPQEEESVVVKPAVSTPVNHDEDVTLSVTKTVVSELLVKMKVRARVDVKFYEPEASNEDRTVLVEIMGDDLSILIGRRSEVLNALQYISGLIVGKELGRWVPLMIDVQGYRTRRERQLRQLATRLAEQAVATGRRQVLEPMPPNERRIIHIALRDHPLVSTESTGEEPNRKVMIILKKP